MRSVRRLGLTGAIAIALLAAVPAVAFGSSVLVARGQAGAYPWKLTVSSWVIGPDKIPGVCMSFLWAWGPGQAIGNGFPVCIAPAIGHETPHGERWSFDLHAAGYHGVYPVVSGGSGGIRGLVMLVDPRAATVVATLRDGEVIRVRTHALPSRLDRAARIAWAVTGASPSSAAALQVRTVFAYAAHHRLVGHYG